MDETRICPKCNGEMKRGNLVFQMGATQGNVTWSEKGGERLVFRQLPLVQAYLCQKCGYLENYVDVSG